MKKPFYLGVAIIVLLVLGLLVYGVYLNQHSEDIIEMRLNNTKLPLKGAEVKTRDLYPLAEMNLINLSSNSMIDVTSVSEGQIVKEFVQRNDKVQEGTPIIELYNDTVELKLKQADIDILEAEAILLQAKTSYARYAELIEQDAISRERFDEAEMKVKLAEAGLENRKMQKQLLMVQKSRQTITSPIKGKVLRIYKPQGSYVAQGTPVMLIGNFEKLYFKQVLEDSVVKNIATNNSMYLQFSKEENFSKAYGSGLEGSNQGVEEKFKLSIAEISPALTEDAQQREVTFEIDNSSGMLEPGFYDFVSVKSDLPYKCLTVPISAMIDDKWHSLFIVENGLLKQRRVVTGISDGKYVEILSGLSEGEIVITSGTDGLQEDIQIEVTVEEG